jgi:hypothetical protein
MNNLLKKKISFSEKLEDAFSLISFNGNYSIAGTGNLKSILYPSDYDLFEEVIETNDKNQALNHIVKRFQEIFKKIKNSNFIFLIDFKCGVHHNSYFDKYNNLNEFLIYLNDMYQKKLINLSEYKKALKLKKPDDIKEFTRSLYILRWTIDEVLRGNKYLKNGDKVFLFDCILDNTVIKLDCILHYNYSIFMEISEIYVFKVKNHRNNVTTGEQIHQGITNDYKKFMYEGKIYKALKRLFSIYKFKKDMGKCKELIKFFNSNEGLLNKIIGDLEIYVIVLEKIPKIKIDEIKFGLQTLKSQLANMYQFNIPNDFILEFDKMSKIDNKSKLIKNINLMIGKLNTILQKIAKKWISVHKNILIK